MFGDGFCRESHDVERAGQVDVDDSLKLFQRRSTVAADDFLVDLFETTIGEDYAIEVKVEGFQPIKYAGIKVNVGQTTPVDVYLEVITEEQPAAEYKIIEKVNRASSSLERALAPL